MPTCEGASVVVVIVSREAMVVTFTMAEACCAASAVLEAVTVRCVADSVPGACSIPLPEILPAVVVHVTLV
jgi:hypothetical protein